MCICKFLLYGMMLFAALGGVALIGAGVQSFIESRQRKKRLER